jgi:hypothetical protein
VRSTTTTDASRCAVAKFGRETGREHLVGLYSAPLCALSEPLLLAVVSGGDRTAWSYGALVSRLEKLCPDTPVTQSNWSAIDAYLCETVSA